MLNSNFNSNEFDLVLLFRIKREVPVIFVLTRKKMPGKLLEQWTRSPTIWDCVVLSPVQKQCALANAASTTRIPSQQAVHGVKRPFGLTRPLVYPTPSHCWSKQKQCWGSCGAKSTPPLFGALQWRGEWSGTSSQLAICVYTLYLAQMAFRALQWGWGVRDKWPPCHDC